MNSASRDYPTRLMVMAGGTGGHVFPALAVAKSLQAQGTQITWLGTRRGLEAKVIPENQIPIEWVSVEGLRGKSAASLVLAPFKLLRALWQSLAAIRRVKPDCVLGMGGFVAGPGGVAARLMGRPLIVHEQNTVAGLTNKYLAKIASRVLTGFPKVAELPSSATWVGNPVRESITTARSNLSPNINVLIIGGSQGAHSFNVKLPAVFKQLALENVSVWHQCGRGRAVQTSADYQELGVSAKVSEFIDDMAAAYRWADLLICRAGAMTIAECCAAGRPALFVPYPFSAGDHQLKNAEVMVSVGAAKLLRNDQIDKPEMLQVLRVLLSEKPLLKEMGDQAFSLHKPDALKDVVAVCQEYLNA